MQKLNKWGLLEFHELIAPCGIPIVPASTSAESGGVTDRLRKDIFKEMQATREFLCNWFAGRLEKPESLADFYLSKVLDSNFNIVRTDGTRLDRQQTLSSFFEQLHGFDPGVLRHDNSKIVILLDTGTIAVAGYREHHVYAGHETINAVTGVFLKSESAPNGVSWLLVHETPGACNTK